MTSANIGALTQRIDRLESRVDSMNTNINETNLRIVESLTRIETDVSYLKAKKTNNPLMINMNFAGILKLLIFLSLIFGSGYAGSHVSKECIERVVRASEIANKVSNDTVKTTNN